MNLKEILVKEDYSICTSSGYHSKASGIAPVIDRIREDRYFFKDQVVADKIIGKASAMLLVYSGVKEIQAIVLSEAGKEILDRYGISYDYETLTDQIVNRRGDGMCPMELTVKDIDDLKEAYEALDRKTAPL